MFYFKNKGTTMKYKSMNYYWNKICLVLLVLSSILEGNAYFIKPIKEIFSEDRSLMQTNISEAPNNTKNICTLEACVKTASFIKEQLNPQANPCDDFYDFACGNIVNNTNITSSYFITIQDEINERLRRLLQKEIKDTDSPATIKAKTLYSSCLEIDAANITTQLKTIFNQLGGWPLLEGDNWNGNNFSWVETNIIGRKIGVSFNSLFEMSVNPDPKNSTKRLITFERPYLEVITNPSNFPRSDNDYQDFLQTSVNFSVLLGAPYDKSFKEMMDVLNFLKNITVITFENLDIEQNMTNLDNVMKLSEMNALINSVQWVEYINTLLPANVQVDGNESVFVDNPVYFRNLEKLLEKNSKRVVANYMLGTIIYNLQKSIKRIMMDTSADRSAYPQQWKDCVQFVSTSGLNLAAGNMYIKKYFTEETKTVAEKLVKYVRNEFDRTLNSIDWLDEKTRRNALLKSRSIIPFVAYPKELFQDNILTEFYANLTINENDLLKNMMQMNIFETDRNFCKLRERVDRSDWRNLKYDVSDVNAYNYLNYNIIVLSPGILQGIFFNSDLPMSVNFGCVGSLIGHEIVHGFDDTGKQKDELGNLRNWWTEESEKKFRDKTQCLIYQYGNYSVPGTEEKVNGAKTLGDNIADNGGIKQAYKAYQKWIEDNGMENKLPGLNYTPNQLFWISFGQTHCNKNSDLKSIKNAVHSPDEYRVNGTLSNSEEFSRDWNCSIKSKMNPKVKCSIW